MLLIPESIWSTMLDAFSNTPGDVERVAYLDGVRQADFGVVTTLTLPNANLKPFNYTVSADGSREAGLHLRAHGLLRLAQVHTHPDRQVGHSRYDNEHAYAQTAGAISIVLPDHARHRPPPNGDGVHLQDRGVWRQVAIGEVDRVVRLIPSILDFRA